MTENYDSVSRRGNVEIDFSFVSMNDNHLIATNNSRKERNLENSADARYYQKKNISRSKSPIMKNLEKNPSILHSKSREISISNKLKNQQSLIDESDFLLQKLKEVEIVAYSDEKDYKKKVEKI